jgi:hypothetical protein
VQALARLVIGEDDVPRPAATPSTVSPRIASVLRRGLVLDPRRRFPSMTELATALEHAATSPWRSWLPGVAVAAAVMGVGASLYAVDRSGEQPVDVVEPAREALEPPLSPVVVPTDDARAADVDAPLIHRVAPFEDIASIAERYGVTESALRTWNELQPGAPLGDEIAVREPTRRPLPWQHIDHVVKPDEADWAALAGRFRVDEAELRTLNEGTGLEPGAMIEVWIDPKPYPRPPSPRLLDAPAIEAHGSQSRGYPSRGTIDGGVQVPESPLYVRRSPSILWGSAHAVATLQRAMFSFRQEVDYPGAVVLSDMSKRGGGDLRPHRSHQSGREIDMWLPSLPGVFEPEHVQGRERRPLFEEIDWHATWGLVRALVGTGAVRDIFLDWRYQEFLYRAAVSSGATETELRWIQWPRPATSLEGVVIHSDGHLSHVHVRFDCARWEADCGDEKYRFAGD